MSEEPIDYVDLFDKLSQEYTIKISKSLELFHEYESSKKQHNVLSSKINSILDILALLMSVSGKEIEDLTEDSTRLIKLQNQNSNLSYINSLIDNLKDNKELKFKDLEELKKLRITLKNDEYWFTSNSNNNNNNNEVITTKKRNFEDKDNNTSSKKLKSVLDKGTPCNDSLFSSFSITVDGDFVVVGIVVVSAVRVAAVAAASFEIVDVGLDVVAVVFVVVIVGIDTDGVDDLASISFFS
ncbi:hypothetical protein WICMUC_002103 [Wickerhamomyces mucosus]|uniref:Uncharacterized protein n=1 Tax=Wickerhamomyces mucosus TaxID=1378264 RepID=A0A9P8PQB4_9ASCO|nr:hypothetical protein WICMUC_002103 [Wickerhamomyces mucosus]